MSLPNKQRPLRPVNRAQGALFVGEGHQVKFCSAAHS